MLRTPFFWSRRPQSEVSTVGKAALWLVLLCWAQLAFAQSPPPLPGMREQPGHYPNALVRRGPWAKYEAIQQDRFVTNLQTKITERVATNWFAGELKKDADCAVTVFGSTFSVPVYTQRGTVTTSHIMIFVYNGREYSFYLDQRVTHQALRYYRLDGTNAVYLTNSPVLMSPVAHEK